MIISEMEIRLRADIARLQRDMDSARQVVGNATASMERAANSVRTAFTGMLAGMGAQQLGRMVDEYAKFTAQLRLATLSQREYANAYADVKRISTQSTQGLSETGMLYARIANGTRELGLAQGKVAAITETVNLALLVSGATASEAASAQLQLSQAFASGTLRGEEFNSVNEAAPRLMKALADGLGVPVGALKKMAEEGKITSAIMGEVLPEAVDKLREESKEFQTISGAFTVLRNEMMEFVGVQANASGAVSGVVSAIGMLSNNLGLLAGVITTLAVSKLSTMLSGWGVETYRQVVANNALRTSTLASAVANTEAAAVISAAKLAEAQANVRTAATAANLANARVAELRSAVLAADGAVALAIATNGLIPAQARAIALSEAHSIALAQQAVAGNAATVTAGAAGAALTAQGAATGIAARAMGVLRGAMTFLGGPIGTIVTLLGLAATAWMVWGNKAKEGNDKAVESFDEAHKRIVKGLDEQIDKNQKLLQMRNLGATKSEAEKALPFVTQLAAASERLNQINNRTGEFAKQSNTQIEFERIKVLRAITEQTEKMAKAESTGAAVAAQSVDERVKAFKKEHATKQEQMNAELKAIADLKGKTSEYGEMERRIREKYADKNAASALKQEETAYQNLVTSIRGKMAANELEIQGHDKLSESQKMTITLDAAIGTGKNKLSTEHVNEARALIGKVEAQEQAIEAQQRAAQWADIEAKNDSDHYDRLRASTAAIDDRIKQMEREIETYGLTESAAIEMEKAKLEAKLAAGPATYAELIALDEQIAKMGKLAELARTKEGLEFNVDVTQAKELLDIMSAIDDQARQAAQGMANSFGTVGKAIGGLTTALSGLGKSQAAIAAQLAAATKAAGSDQVKVAAATTMAARQTAQAQIQSYGDMAAAGKGFFDEHSRGYQAMEAAEKTFRAFEVALAIKTMLEKSGILQVFTSMFVASKATETAATVASVAPDVAASMAKGQAAAVAGVANQAGGEQYSAWARMAAMAAVMAGLGFAVGGIGGKDTTAVDRQKATGTGSVLGDANAKSESIAKAIQLSAANSNIELNYTSGMLRALLSIESSLSGLGGILARNGVSGATPAGSIGSMSKLGSAIGSPIQGMPGGEWLGKAYGKVTNAILGGDVTNLDGGITSNVAKVSAIRNGGLNAQSYADMEKEGGMFHSDDNWTDRKNLGTEVSNQFGLVITGIVDSVDEAARMIGVGGDEFTKWLNEFTVGIGKISTKGLTGEEIQKQLEAQFSMIADSFASQAVSGLAQFQKVGEGYFETLVRVANNYANLDAVLNSIGKTFGATGLASIEAREHLIELAGGIDELASKTAGFAENFLSEAERLAPVQKYVTEQLTAMGLANLRSRDSFKQYVLGLDLTSEAQRQQYVALMDLQEAFAKVYPEIEGMTASLTDAKSALAEAYNAEVDAIGATIDRMGSFAKSLRGLRESALLGGLSPLSPQQKYAEAKAQYEAVLSAARGGDEGAQSNYQSAFISFLEASRAVFASSGQYQMDFAYAQAATEEAARWAEMQVDAGQAQIAILKAQVSSLIDINKSVLSVREALLQYSQASAANTGSPTMPQPVSVGIPFYAPEGRTYGAGLEAEVRALNARIDAQTKVIEAQTLQLTVAAYGSAEESADRIAGGIKAASYQEERVSPE